MKYSDMKPGESVRIGDTVIRFISAAKSSTDLRIDPGSGVDPYHLHVAYQTWKTIRPEISIMARKNSGNKIRLYSEAPRSVKISDQF